MNPILRKLQGRGKEVLIHSDLKEGIVDSISVILHGILFMKHSIFCEILWLACILEESKYK